MGVVSLLLLCGSWVSNAGHQPEPSYLAGLQISSFLIPNFWRIGFISCLEKPGSLDNWC